MFEIYLKQGFQHITDIKGYDHIAFLIALVAGYSIRNWKRVLGLVTAFTIGHSITLALSAFRGTLIPSNVIEFLVPITILAMAIMGIVRSKKTKRYSWQIAYGITLLFGLIHGMAFSNYFSSLLGKSTNITQTLFAFNIGVELGQILIVLIILLFSTLLIKILGIKQHLLALALSIIAAVIAIRLIIQTWPF